MTFCIGKLDDWGQIYGQTVLYMHCKNSDKQMVVTNVKDGEMIGTRFTHSISGPESDSVNEKITYKKKNIYEAKEGKCEQ